MIPHDKDRDWRRINEAARPTLASVRRTERELQELQREGVPPLEPAHVERLLARTHGRIVDRAPRRLARRSRLVALAATVLLTAMVGVAMRAHEIIWPSHSSPMRTLAFQGAVDDVSTTETDYSDWSAGMGFLAGRFHGGLDALLELRSRQPQNAAAPDDEEVVRAAAAACRRLADGKRCPASGVDADMVSAVQAAVDRSAPRAGRLTALHRIEELVAASREALRAANAGERQRADVKRAHVGELEKRLDDLSR